MQPLRVAAFEGHANLVRLLPDNGTPVDEKNSIAWEGSYLRELESKHNLGVVRVTFDYGVDTNARGGLCGNALQPWA